MRNLWVKIGLGATGIFVVGMMGVTVAKQAKAAATTAINDVVGRVPAVIATAVERDRTARLAGLGSIGQGASQAFVEVPFRLDGDDIGVIRSGSLRRDRKDALPSMQLEVELTSQDAADMLDDCVLVPLKHQQSDFSGGFRCATEADHDLVTFGRVRFQPLRNSIPVMITSNQAADLRHGEPFEANADLSGEVKVDARGHHGEQVRVRAGDHGANIRINDEMGRDIFRLIADSLGASLKIHDEKGREIVSLVAGDGRLSLNVDTAGN